MNAPCRHISLGFTKEKVEAGQHIIYVYKDDAERKKIIAKFLESGLLEGERVLCVSDTVSPDEMSREMAELGVDIESDECSFLHASAVYTPKGYFSPDEVISVTETFYAQTVKEGYPGARGTGEMTWATKGNVDTKDLLEYECRITSLLEEIPYTSICQYDAARFNGSIILDMLRVHPVMIVRGQLVKNPFFDREMLHR